MVFLIPLISSCFSSKYYLVVDILLDISMEEYSTIFLVEGRELLQEIGRYLHDLGWIILSYYLDCLPSMTKSILPTESTSKISLYMAKVDIGNFYIRMSSGNAFIVHSVFQEDFLEAGLKKIWSSFLISGEYKDHLGLPDEFWEILLRKIMGYPGRNTDRIHLGFPAELRKAFVRNA